jgi:hypothetical protein
MNYRLEYQQRDGKWRRGILAYTQSEAKVLARVARTRSGRSVRVKKIR